MAKNHEIARSKRGLGFEGGRMDSDQSSKSSLTGG